MYNIAYYHLIVISATAIRGGQRCGTAFTVPWKSSSLTSRSHSDGIDASYVSVTSAIVRSQAPIPGSPHVNATSAASALNNRVKSITLRSRVLYMRYYLYPV